MKLRSTLPLEKAIERFGHIPLPPYIDRSDEPADAERYQTVYAAESGSVAAPTAGLHFTNKLLTTLKVMGNRGSGSELVKNEEQAQWTLERLKVGHPTESHHVMARVSRFQEMASELAAA